ncbi:hypothetical protein Nepgr_001059 [Nepenthes gracilis]|uniref:Uncharacterized protein n=1 Tax=Nepenthes gracilis TaxID=150966 RepID=A0AAD3P2B1_NEPGR|nr:hypothetical protein Nepgr_001059 [Nepenthes gracilis]
MVLKCCGPGVADLALKLYLIDCYRIDANAQHACVRESSVLDAGAGAIGLVQNRVSLALFPFGLGLCGCSLFCCLVADVLCTLGYKFCVLETDAVTAAVGIAVLQQESWCCLCCRFPHAFWGPGGGSMMFYDVDCKLPYINLGVYDLSNLLLIDAFG